MAKYIITEEQAEDLECAIQEAIAWHNNCDGYHTLHDKEIEKLIKLSASLRSVEIE